MLTGIGNILEKVSDFSKMFSGEGRFSGLGGPLAFGLAGILNYFDGKQDKRRA